MDKTDREDNGAVMTRRKLLQTAGMTGAAMIAGYGMSSLLKPTPAMAAVTNRNFVAVTTSAEAQDVIDNSLDNLYLNNVAISTTITIARSIVILGGPQPSKPVVDLPALTPCLRITAPDDASVVMISVRIDGDKANQSSPGGSQDGGKHGLHVKSKCAIYALNCEFNNNITDGLDYNGLSTSAENKWKIFENCNFIGNGRQGTTVGTGDKLHFKNCRFNNTSGLLPMAGVDIEPDFTTSYIGTIIFEDCEMSGNAGHGLEINSMSASGQMDIRVIRGTMLGNTPSDKQAIYISSRVSSGTNNYKNFSVDGLRTSGGIKSIAAKASFSRVFLNRIHFEVTSADATINLANADKIVVANTSWEQNAAGWAPWTFTNVKELYIDECDLPAGTHSATNSSSGTAITLSGVKYASINKCSTWRTGYRLIASTQTDGGRGIIKIHDCNFQTGDGNNFRLTDIADCDVDFYGNHVPQHSDSDVYIRGTSVGWLQGNRFEATSPIVHLGGTATLRWVKANINLADV